MKSSVGGKASAANHGVSKTFSSFMKQEEIAKTTGGKATYSNNDLVGSLEKATEVGGNYYSVSYSPSNKNFDGHLRRIEVKLKEGKYRLAYRHAYYGVSGDAAGAPNGDKLFASMKHGAPESHQLVFEAHVQPTGSPERGTKEQMTQLAQALGAKDSAKSMSPIPLQAYTVDYAVMAVPPGAGGDRDPQFELAAAAYDGDGNLLNSTVSTTEKSDPAGAPTPAKNAYRVEQEFDAPLDARFLRLAVRDTRTGRVGAMEISLPVAVGK